VTTEATPTLAGELRRVAGAVQTGESLPAAIDGTASPRRVRTALVAAVATLHGGEPDDWGAFTRFCFLARQPEIVAVIERAITRAEAPAMPPGVTDAELTRMLDLPPRRHTTEGLRRSRHVPRQTASTAEVDQTATEPEKAPENAPQRPQTPTRRRPTEPLIQDKRLRGSREDPRRRPAER